MYWMLWTSILFGLHRKFLKLILFARHSSSDEPRVSTGKKTCQQAPSLFYPSVIPTAAISIVMCYDSKSHLKIQKLLVGFAIKSKLLHLSLLRIGFFATKTYCVLKKVVSVYRSS